MILTSPQIVMLIAIITVGTMITRFVPFLLFPESKTPPQTIVYLSDALPCAIIGFLVVYCLKGVSISVTPHGLPELISLAFIALIYWKKENTLLSIVGGTALYMFLVQVVFA